jgi:formylglycine-generating enzyme required for sulfatase activity
LPVVAWGKELSKLQFETVFVNEQGEIIETRPCEAFYFDEILAFPSSPKIPSDSGSIADSIRMIYIPAGVFCMGSPPEEKGRYEDEGPMRPVSVSAFFMGQTPITEAQWRFVAALPQEVMKLDLNPSRNGDNHPVVNVSWQQAMEFCARLSRYTNRNYRLPSEAEWEYACRAISREQLSALRLQTSDNGESIWREWVLGQMRDFSEAEERQIIELWNRYFHQPFHFGPTITSELANYDGRFIYQNTPPGKHREKLLQTLSFSPNAFGLNEMHGNVWEWCLDPWHRNYENGPKDGIVWDEGRESRYENTLQNIHILSRESATRIVCGGSWESIPRLCRSASHGHYNPDDGTRDLGFRVVWESSSLA